MLTQEIKKHIDTARQILVGVVPNPTSQIDQITNALIYKFMDDMDQSVIKLGGKASFFTDDLEKYSWSKIMDSKVVGQDRMNLYQEALEKLSRASQLPPLFRNIFKSAYLPYRSPEVLNLFLKEIAYFDYSHPEDLGDAYEYLLSIMSSQGDAGQFRTPRHIIDFIVDVVNPTKDDKILDPACGTAGFLISAYKHILKQHDGIDDPDKRERALTPEEKRGLTDHFEGYDIDPGMVRISQVNMYLHQFKDPKIFQYDSLSSDERWNDKFDVILANPPFMSPKGGIKPHSRFSVQSSRSEVLFVDYIMSHLRPKGRAGIIVPEGIIFQSGTAYKQLRKNLVEDGLYAVVSLPNGVFNPYSGVKTSILFFDNEISKKTDKILFVKVLNDGYDLGAQRRSIDRNDLVRPDNELDATKVLKGQRVAIKTGTINPWLQENSLFAYEIAKKKIAESGDYNLSGDRYRETVNYTSEKWPMVDLGDIIEFESKSIRKSGNGLEKGLYKFFVSSQIQNKFINEADYKEENIILGTGGTASVHIASNFSTSADTFVFHSKNVQIRDLYIYYLLQNNKELLENGFRGQGIKHLSKEYLLNIKIPIPSLEVQKQIVEQIDGYQKIIDGIQQAVSNLKPRIEIDPEWEKVKLPQISENHDNKRKPVTKSDRTTGKYPYYGASGIVDYVEDYIFDGEYLLISEDGANLLARSTPIAFSISGKNWVNNHAHVLKFNNLETQKFVEIYINQIDISDFVTGMAQPKLNQQALNTIEIPLPSPEIQKEIVEKIEFERSGIEKAKELIPIFEQHIKNIIDKLWSK